MSKRLIGYIQQYDESSPQRFKLRQETYTQTISPKGNKIKSKLFYGSIDYEEIRFNTDILQKNPALILVKEPFFLEDEALTERVSRWVEWANSASPEEYDPFYTPKEEE